MQFADQEKYENLADCWTLNGKFHAFMVLRKTQDAIYPFYISPLCRLKIPDQSSQFSFVSESRVLRFVGRDNLQKLNKSLPLKLEPTTSDHVPLPTDDSTVYRFSGEIITVNKNGMIYYDIKQADFVVNLNISFKDLVKMGQGERFRTFWNYSE